MTTKKVLSTPVFAPALMALSILAIAGGCVPADESLGLGSVQFTFISSQRTQEGLIADETEDNWALKFDRVILGFKTMTIGKIGVPDLCSYRGRGAVSNVVFDPRPGLVQTFNGISPVDCPDVGVIFGTPDNATTLTPGVTSQDLIDLLTGTAAHGIVEATATGESLDPDTFEFKPRTVKIKLRFQTDLTSTRFGGCREASRGIRILSNKREDVIVRFAAENLFRDAVSTSSPLRVNAFAQADAQGNNDGIVTMDELEELRLTSIGGGTYQLPNGTRNGSMADYVRALFRFTLMFRTEIGLCVGNEPGSNEDQ